MRDLFFALREDINIYANLYKCNEGSEWLGTRALSALVSSLGQASRLSYSS